VFLERLNRSRARYDQSSPRPNRLHELRGWRAWLVVVLCVIPPLVGFVLPMGILGQVIWSEPAPLFTARFFTLTGNSLSLALIAAGAAVMLAALMAYAARLAHSPAVTLANRVAGLGYAIPGAVIAVGILVPLGRLDNLLASWLESAAGIQVGLLLTGTLFAVVYAYQVRFLAIAQQTLEAGLAKIKPSMEDAARSLGLSPGRTLVRVHAPLMWGSLLTAGLMVFVDVMKELPATFALRPFNFDTLAVQAYNMAKDERLPEAAAASLVIVAAGLIPIALLARATSARRAAPAMAAPALVTEATTQ
jgi:iron(III) transport system permease protein